ncbi:MAG: ISAs1 family transposase, partial [Cyanobacteria bacterium P01_H01_bin.21]
MPAPNEHSVTLLEHFKELEDPRVDYLIEHRLLDIIGLTICAVICGADTWVDIELYGKAKEEWLTSFLAFPNGIPSHDTIARLFAALNPERLQSCFLSWVRSVAHLSAGEIVAIDGKTLRHSYDSSNDKGAILLDDNYIGLFRAFGEFRKSLATTGHAAITNRFSSSSKPALPYICRFSIFNLLF